MTVKPIKKEMNFEGSRPSNDAPMPPQLPADNGAKIPDHTHPEYDQMLVKVQELESALSNMQMGGVGQEQMNGNAIEPKKKDEDEDKKYMTESAVRKLIKEEIQGVPENPDKKKQESPDSAANAEVPQTTQPPNGEAPSGGGFDSDDKLNKKDADNAVSETPKPSSDLSKPKIVVNKMQLAKRYIERAKKLMSEANGEDPTKPNPGATEKQPKKMDGQVPSKNPSGGTEQLDDNGDDMDDSADDDKLMEKVYTHLRREIKEEKAATNRQSLVGMSSATNAETQAKQEEYINNRKATTSVIKEYLQKAGHHKALNLMTAGV